MLSNMILTLGPTPALQRTMIFKRLTVDAVNRAVEVRQAASGKSINVARVLRSMGRQVLATGFLGGQNGRTMRGDMDLAGLRHDFVEVAPATRLCITLVDRGAGTATELVEESVSVAPPDYEALLKKLDQLLPGAAVLVLSGSLPPGAPANFYRRCVELGGERVKVILDARGDPLLEALEARPVVVKPNRRELAETFGIDPEDEAGVRRAMAEAVGRGAGWIIATMGADGALLSDGRRFWRLQVPHFRAVNPIGSGDAFAAGLAAALSDGRDVPDACRLGAACAAANALTDQAGFIEAGRLAELEIGASAAVEPAIGAEIRG
jgi:tagatose 6-phosphate kinase